MSTFHCISTVFWPGRDEVEKPVKCGVWCDGVRGGCLVSPVWTAGDQSPSWQHSTHPPASHLTSFTQSTHIMQCIHAAYLSGWSWWLGWRGARPGRGWEDPRAAGTRGRGRGPPSWLYSQVLCAGAGRWAWPRGTAPSPPRTRASASPRGWSCWCGRAAGRGTGARTARGPRPPWTRGAGRGCGGTKGAWPRGSPGTRRAAACCPAPPARGGRGRVSWWGAGRGRGTRPAPPRPARTSRSAPAARGPAAAPRSPAPPPATAAGLKRTEFSLENWLNIFLNMLVKYFTSSNSCKNRKFGNIFQMIVVDKWNIL